MGLIGLVSLVCLWVVDFGVLLLVMSLGLGMLVDECRYFWDHTFGMFVGLFCFIWFCRGVIGCIVILFCD